ncbi:hypothetical protein [Sporofaciens musculi]
MMILIGKFQFTELTAQQKLNNLPLPARAAKRCFLSTARNKNTIIIKPKSPTRKSCSRPMCRQRFVLWAGNKRLIKRRLFDQFIEQEYSI